MNKSRIAFIVNCFFHLFCLNDLKFVLTVNSIVNQFIKALPQIVF